MTPDTTERDAAPCFSVITPAYNAADSVAATIASVRAQDLGDWEMVVVDDGSSDTTADVAREVAAGDPRIRVVSQPNAGVSAARNAAIGLSHGEFICTLDADDRYKPDYLSSMSRFIAEYPGCDLYSCNGEFVFPSGMLVPVRKGRRFKRAQSFSVEEMFERNLVFIMATIRRTALERIGGFREDLTVAEDYDVWMRILMTGGAHMYNPERLGLYGLTEGSASTDFDRLERARLEVMQYLAERYPGQVSPAAYERSMERQRMRVRLAEAERRLSAGESRGMRAEFFSAWEVLPTPARRYVGGLSVLLSPQLYRRIFLGRLYPPQAEGSAS